MLHEKAMLVELSVSCWQARKFDREVSDEVAKQHGVDRKTGRYNRILIDKRHLKPITSAITVVRNTHKSLTLPYNDDGLRIRPNAVYFDYNKRMNESMKTFTDAVEQFCANYPAYVEQARKQLKTLFHEDDYPSADEVREKFDIQIVEMPLPKVEDFRTDLSKAETAKIKRRAEKIMQERVQHASRDIYNRLHEVVAHVLDRLQDESKVFKDVTFDTLRHVVNMVDSLNFTEDAELTKLARDIENKLCRVQPAALREDKVLRKSKADQAAEILKRMGVQQ